MTEKHFYKYVHFESSGRSAIGFRFDRWFSLRISHFDIPLAKHLTRFLQKSKRKTLPLDKTLESFLQCSKFSSWPFFQFDQESILASYFAGSIFAQFSSKRDLEKILRWFNYISYRSWKLLYFIFWQVDFLEAQMLQIFRKNGDFVVCRFQNVERAF